MQGQAEVILQTHLQGEAAHEQQVQSGSECVQTAVPLWNVSGVCQLRDTTETGAEILPDVPQNSNFTDHMHEY